MNETPKEWFESWFDSPYYPILYRHRDEAEAQEALVNLHKHLSLPPSATVLDLCCGQGRHSRTLHALGYHVVGIDLSPSAIAYANERSIPGQHFEVQDMRNFSLNERFDAVFNLFTSFGYFSNQKENLRVLTQIYKHLNPGGTLVLDYLNASAISVKEDTLQEQTIDGIVFRTRKFIEGESVVKTIEILDNTQHFQFHERVQLITLEHFSTMLEQTGFELTAVFGNYQLGAYTAQESPRCLIIARKS